MPDTQYNRICPKGLTHLYRMYSEHRVKYPMKRVGERGSVDSFERVSWDEAINYIVERWNAIEEEYGKGSVAFYWGSGQFGTANGCRNNDIWNRFTNVVGTGMINRSVDIAHAHGIVPTVGIGLMFAQNESTDFKNSKTFIVWGANPAISQVQTTHFIIEAKEAGATLIVIDPVYNTISSKADIFVPIKAGTDGALALGMAKLIIDKKWVDESFVKKYTVGPCLVKEDGLFLRQSDLGIEVSGGKDPQIVTDGNGKFAPLSEIEDPVLEGSFEVEGFNVKTSYTLVCEGLEEYDLDRVEEITGVPKTQIEMITDLYANEGPSNIYTAFGLNHYVNGHWNYFCTAILPCLTGNLGKSGAGFGINEYLGFSGNPLSGKPKGAPGVSLDVTNLRMNEILETGKFGKKDAPIKACVFVGCNAMTNGVERNNTKNWLEQLDFILSIDLNFNENALMADVILPAAHWFEEEDIFCLFAAHPYMLYQEKATNPLFESKTDFEIATLLARALGYGEYFQMTDSEFLQEWIETDLAKKFGISYERLKENGAMRMAGPGTYVYAEGNKFTSLLGIYHEKAAPEYNWGQEIDMSKERVPYWEPPHEVREGTELRDRYPFHMLSDHSRFHTHSQWWEAAPLVELAGGEPLLKINPEDAEEYGIEDGDLVRVYNDRGSVSMHAFANAGLPRKMLSAPKGWENRQYIDGHFSSLTSRYVNPACTNASFNDVVVAIEKV